MYQQLPTKAHSMYLQSALQTENPFRDMSVDVLPELHQNCKSVNAKNRKKQRKSHVQDRDSFKRYRISAYGTGK